MAKKLKSLNPIIGTGYKTLSTIKDGEDGNIENFPDTLPKIPRLSYKRLGVSGLEIGWEFEDKIYYTYELYGSTTKGFNASEENLIFQGLASSYFYEAKPGEKWYFKARAKNTHGRYTEFSSELVAYTIKLDNLGEYVEGGSINGALIENATINNAHIKDLHADKITAGVLDADRIGANSITANKIEANAITSEKIQANAITTGKLAANIIASSHIQSGTITSGHIQSDAIESDHIKSNSINSNHIQANTIQSEHIQTGAITAGSGIIAEGAIGSAQISSLDAAKIEAGTIDTSKVTIQGTNGHLKIKGNRLQVFNGTGSNAKERVSLGDVNGNGSVYGLRVRGADGTTILLDENGVKSEGITDGAITNDKISDDANIDGAKLNINSVVNKINEDGTETIQGTKIEVDGTTLNTKLSTITTKQTEDSERISQAQSQITANTNAIKLKVDEQTYTTDKKDMTSKLEKNTSEISAMKGQIALKVEQTDIENAKGEMEGVIDSKLDTAKAEIKVTTDAISQNVSNLSQTVSTKADGSTVTALSSKVGSLETSVNGISGKVSSLETTTTTLGNQVTDAKNTADSAVNKANSAQSTANTNKGNITSLQGEVSTIKSDVAELEVTTSGISQKVSSVESTTSSLTTKVNNAQSTADSKAKVFTTTPTTPYRVGDLWVQGTSGDMMRCKTARTSGSYTASDWEKASKYTDDTKANAVDNKVGTLQSDYNSTKSKVATLETNLDGITQRVSSTESTTSNLSSEINGVKGNVSNLTSRVSNAESKLTKDSLTTTIGNHYTTKTDVDGIVTSKGYQTQSQVQQTVDGLQVKVQQSGGYNLLRNSGFKKDSLHWGTQNYNSPTDGSIGYLNHTAEWGFPNANVKCCQIRLSNQTSKEYGIAQTFNTTIGKKYTISFYYAGHRVPKANMIIRGTTSNSGSWLTSKDFVPTSKSGGNASIDNWALFTHTFTATLNSHTLNIVINDANNDGYMWIAQPMIEEGELHNPYSPHPSEVYDGITSIDKDGITVTASNAKSKTNMSANGFKITKTDTNEDVFKVNSDGTLYMKGQITVTGGSVPTSNLSGTISSNQLNSSITSDINNAKNNASNALNTANSVNSTVNSNKNNWNNAYNRVNEWAYGAVTGTTNINGGMIATNTITADKIASRTITADRIAAGAITANEIKSGTITASMITSGTLDASKVNVTNLNAGNITSGTISGNRIASNSITADKIAVGAISVDKLSSNNENPIIKLFDNCSIDATEKYEQGKGNAIRIKWDSMNYMLQKSGGVDFYMEPREVGNAFGFQSDYGQHTNKYESRIITRDGTLCFRRTNNNDEHTSSLYFYTKKDNHGRKLLTSYDLTSSVTSESTTMPATAYGVKQAYDKAVSAYNLANTHTHDIINYNSTKVECFNGYIVFDAGSAYFRMDNGSNHGGAYKLYPIGAGCDLGSPYSNNTYRWRTVYSQSSLNTSDVKSKEDICYLDDNIARFGRNNTPFLDFIKNDFRPATYMYKAMREEEGHVDADRQIGFIANDIIDTEVGKTFLYNFGTEEETDIMFSPTGYTTVVARALQEEIKRREELEAKCVDLEERLIKLEKILESKL